MWLNSAIGSGVTKKELAKMCTTFYAWGRECRFDKRFVRYVAVTSDDHTQPWEN